MDGSAAQQISGLVAWADGRGIEVYLVPGEILELISFEVLQLVFNLKVNKSVQNLGYKI